MTVALPIALLLLVPWSALAWWVWRRELRATRLLAVPSLQLWDRARPPERADRRRVPPWWVLLGLASCLSAIVGLARPGWTTAQELRVTVDHGHTMSPPGRTDEALAGLRERADELGLALDVQHVPSDAPTLADTTALLLDAAAEGRVLLTDRDLRDAVVVRPATRVQTASVDVVGVDQPPAGPVPQVLVRLGGTMTGEATLIVQSDAGVVEQNVTLPSSPLVVELPGEASAWIAARIAMPGDVWTADDVFAIALQRPSPRLQAVRASPAATRWTRA